MDLTLKQRKWLAIYLKTGNATEAARKVYDCTYDSARTIGWENLTKLDFSEFLEEAGISDQKLTKKLEEGLDANRVVSAVNTKKEATASSNDFIDVPDYSVRHKYLETGLKLKKRLVDKVEHEVKGNQNINVMMYGKNDPLFTYLSPQFQSSGFKPASPNGHAGQAPISSSQLASESSKDDTGDKSVDKMGK